MIEPQLKRFWDDRSGFWRTGICYKENKNFYHFKDLLGHRYRVSKKSINTIEPIEKEVSNPNGNAR